MNRRRLALLILALTLLTVFTYLPALRNGFVWDDDAHLTANPAVTSPGGLRAIWTSFVLPVYYPVTFSTFWLMYRVWGENPLPYHAVTLALHALNAVLLFLVLQRLKIRAAWLIAAVWAVHPVNVESVAWVTELKNTLSGVFFFLTLLCHFTSEAVVPGNGRSDTKPIWYALSLLCCAIALLCKSSTVILPAVLLLCVWWQRGGLTIADGLRSVPFFALSLGISAVAIGAQVKERLLFQGSARDWSLTWSERLILSGKDFWFYLGKILWPQLLTFIYPRWTHDDLLPTEWFPPAAAIIAVVLLWRRRQTNWGRASLFGIGYFVVALSPVLGFFDQYFYQYSFVADHFQYLASIGVVAVVVGLAEAAVVKAPPVRYMLATGAVCVLCVLSWRHCYVFRNHETLWRETLAKNPQAAIAYNNLGALLNDQKRHEEAIGYLQEALRLKPETVEPHNNMAIALTELGRYEQAMDHLQEALRIRPDFAPVHYRLGVLYTKMNRLDDAEREYQIAIRYNPPIPEAFFDLGVVWERQGKRDRAPKAYGDALKLKPDYAAAHNNLANLLAEDGQLDEAIQHYRRAINADPKLENAHRNLGLVLLKAHRYAEAIQTYRDGLKAHPHHIAMNNDLAWLLATCPEAQLRDGARAVQISERLSQATQRKLPGVLDTLAAAYAEAGRFDDAAQTATEAFTLAQMGTDSDLVAGIQSRLRLYESRQPYRLSHP